MKEKTKVYIYTRVSTAVQVDGYSLDAQKSRMKAYAEFNDFEIVGEYEDAGKSGKSIEGRLEFNRMMEDIKSGKDGVSYVLVFKLSRFGRNAADVLSTLQVMQDFDVNLICVEDGIDSSKDAGKLMISVLSAVAEIERENIRVQTMEGRIQKAREGKWNGGFAPYGYKLEKGMLYINEEEAEAIRIIFDQYVHTDIGANGLAKYLANHGINKIQRQNGKNPLFDAALIRRILKNPVYCGKIAYGRRRTEKVHGTRNDYRLVEQENYLLVDGLHEAIVSEGLWHEAQVKLLAQAKKYEKVNNGKDNKVHLLTGLLKCPICGAGMYGNKSIKHKPDGTKYKDFFYYGCKHRTMTRGHKCEYKKQINEELLDGAVAEVIIKLVSNPKFAAMMQQKINMKIDTSAIEQEIANYEKQLRQSYATKSRLIDEIDTLDPDDKHYIKRKADLDDRLYKMYDKIEDTENLLIEARAKKMAIEAEKLTADNIYKVLIYFEKLYAVMDEQEKRQIMESLISEIHIYEERQPNGQWLKSIKFKLPIIEEDMEMSLDSDTHVEADKGVREPLCRALPPARLPRAAARAGSRAVGAGAGACRGGSLRLADCDRGGHPERYAGRDRLIKGEPLCPLCICMSIPNTACSTARAVSAICRSSCVSWVRTPSPSPTMASCTASSTSTAPARPRGFTRSSAARSMSRRAPASTSSTSSTAKRATSCCCVRMRRATATSCTWSRRRTSRAFTSSPASTSTSCASTRRG